MALIKKAVKKAIKAPARPAVKKAIKRPAAGPAVKRPGPPVKKAVKKAAPAAGGNLSPLEKARLARANGTAPKKAAKKIAYTSNADGKATFEAPGDFKPCLYEVTFKTEADGFLGAKITAKRIQGSYDKAPEKNRRPVHKFDPRTLMGIAARIGAATFVSKPENRLPANSVFTVLYRVGVHAPTGTIRTGIKFVKANMTKNNVTRTVELDRAHPIFKRIRRTTKFLPAAFLTAIQPPKLGRGETD